MARLVTLTDEDIEIINRAFEGCPGMYTVSQKVKKKLLKSQQRIKLNSAKGKGRSFQYNISERISKLLDIPYDQQDDNCEIHSREMSQQGVDIILRGEARRLFPFSVECKAVTYLDIPSAVEQAEANAGEDQLGMVAFRQTNFEPVVIFSWRTFEKMFVKYIYGRNV